MRIFTLIVSAVCACSLALGQDTVATLKARADKGDPAAQTELGDFYYGDGRSAADPKAAVYWWKKAASQDYVPAMLALGRAYHNGKIYGNGVDEDFSQAWLWFELALYHGDKTAQEEVQRAEDELGAERLNGAQIRLANMLMKGDNVKRDSKFAIQLYEAAAKGGRSEAKLRLVGLYTSSDEQTRDLPAAQRICGLFDRGDPAASYCLARLERAAPAPDWKRVVTYYEKAVDYGSRPALELGDLYADGQYVRRDYVTAYLLYSRALDRRSPNRVIDDDTPENLDGIITRMNVLADQLGPGGLEALAKADKTSEKHALMRFSERYYTNSIASSEVEAAASVCAVLERNGLAVAHYCYARVERATANPNWQKVVSHYTFAVTSPAFRGCAPVEVCMPEPRASFELADLYADGTYVKRDNVRAIVLYALSAYGWRQTRGTAVPRTASSDFQKDQCTQSPSESCGTGGGSEGSERS